MPIIPSQIDPHPTLALRGQSHLSSVFEDVFPSYFQRSHRHSSARPFGTRHVGSSAGRFTSTTRAPAFDESILGSGDFTVMSGGTFYPDGESQRRPSFDYFGSGSSFHDDHGRPFALPLESSQDSDDPFADFKDFADITAGIDTDFSHNKAVYVNTNGTKLKHEPRNILEQLQMIDEEKQERAEVSTAQPITDTKLSKFKCKLFSAKFTKEPKIKAKKPEKISTSSSADYLDPLKAES